MSIQFCLYYIFLLTILGIYAIAWQQIIKKIPLSVAYANKAVTTIWASVWGLILFHERITTGKLLGVIVIIAGVVLYAIEGNEQNG